jgi:DNA processing protein
MPTTLDDTELAAWLGLSRLGGTPAQRFALARASGAVAALAALAGRGQRSDRPDRDLARVRRWLDAAPENGLVTAAQTDYPPLLAEIPDPPLLLFTRGQRKLLLEHQVAIVGSRSPSPQGREDAAAFAAGLARAGLTITSGLAVGIDGAAHRGALHCGRTVAVTGCGPDIVYPRIHAPLAREIVDSGGLLVTEFLPGAPPRPAHFPRRNRIISGLAVGVVVIEAAPRSGSLITARLAGAHGREVFARPGSIHSPLARGCHRLIRDGAKLIEDVDDILVELPFLLSYRPAPAKPSEGAGEAGAVSAAKGSVPALADHPDAARLLACMDFEPTTVDALVQRSGLTAERVSSILLHMELEGLLHACPGGRFSRRAGAEEPHS